MARTAKPKLPEVDIVDFETKPIEPAPDYPPEPVGVSIQLLGEKQPHYYAWGHPTGNNCTKRDAQKALHTVFSGRRGILCHHAKFDLNVAHVHMDMPLVPSERIHDTVWLAFLNDPYAKSLKLKELAEDLLGMPPEERDAIRDWAIAEKLMPKSKKEAGHLIWKAPGGLVGKYANGDIIRTRKLFALLYPIIVERSMLVAYNREQRLMPVLMANEAEGIATDGALLRADAKKYGAARYAEKFGSPDMFSGGAMDQADAWLRKALKSPGLNVDADEDLAQALINSGKASEDHFFTTPTGKMSTAKDSIINAVTDGKVLGVLQYRSKLATANSTFLLPWLRESELSKSRVRPSWNQTRLHNSAGNDAGAKTGRLSASRFMNVPKPYLEKLGKYMHPAYAKLPELPEVRKYLKAEKGMLWGKRDYSQQELRVLGHFEDGALKEEYALTPYMDIHDRAAAMMIAMGIMTDRDQMKTVGFALIYGMGLGSLAERLGVSVSEAKRLKNAYLSMFPGLEELIDDLTGMGKQGLAMRTWGGREYFVEPGGWSEKFRRMMSYEYKLINFLVQGSSADCTKEALIRYHSARRDGLFKVTVHDEININAPKKAMQRELLLLREVMASIEFDVLMLSDGAAGENWGSLTKIKEPPLLHRPTWSANEERLVTA